MSHDYESADTHEDSEASVDLHSVFAHPAGLRAARYVVGSYIKAAESALPPPSLGDTTHLVPNISYDASPEVTNLLRIILALSDSEGQTFEDHDGGMDSGLEGVIFDGLPRSEYGASEDLPSSFSHKSSSNPSHKQSSDNSFATYTTMNSNSFYSQPAPRLRPDQLSRSISTMSSSGGPSGSQTQGSNSPYRIESPSRSTQSTPQPIQSSLGGSFTSLGGSSSQNSLQRNNEDQPSLFDHSTSSSSLHHRSDNQSSPSHNPTAKHNSPIQAHSKAAFNTHNLIPSNTIKSFIPVNKNPAISSTGYPRPNEHIGSPKNMDHSPKFQHGSAGVLTFDNELDSAMVPASGSLKRKTAADEFGIKKAKTDKGVKRIIKLKEPKPKSAAQKLGPDLWMRILEFTPPTFIFKARLLSKAFKECIDNYSSIFVNQRLENYGIEMPPASAILLEIDYSDPPQAVVTDAEDEEADVPTPEAPKDNQLVKPQLSERQYSNLLGGKGCLNPGCTDKKTSRTHWSFAVRWCCPCWKTKIEREDKIIKSRSHQVPRNIILELLACIRSGIHDSFMKPHDFVTEDESRDRTRGAPRLYRYYAIEDVDKIIAEYNKRLMPPYVDDPQLTAGANASARAVHQLKETALAKKRQDWIDAMKLRNIAWMEKVKKIETLIRKRREETSQPHEVFREARRELFSARAKETLPHIDIDFVQSTKAYKAAVRIFRDGGTERGWQALKPKIEKEWDDYRASDTYKNKQSNLSRSFDGAADDDQDMNGEETLDVEANKPRSNSPFPMGSSSSYQSMAPARSSLMDEFTRNLSRPSQPQSRFAQQYGSISQQPTGLAMLANVADNANPLTFPVTNYMSRTSSGDHGMYGNSSTAMRYGSYSSQFPPQGMSLNPRSQSLGQNARFRPSQPSMQNTVQYPQSLGQRSQQLGQPQNTGMHQMSMNDNMTRNDSHGLNNGGRLGRLFGLQSSYQYPTPQAYAAANRAQFQQRSVASQEPTRTGLAINDLLSDEASSANNQPPSQGYQTFM